MSAETSGSRAPTKLSIEGLGVTYLTHEGAATEAVRDISLEIVDRPGAGEIVVFLGASGCGKSTILKTVAGLIPPSKGRVLVGGKPVTGVGRDRGMVFQAYTSFGWLTVRDNVEYGLRLQGVPAAERREKSKKYLEEVGLSEFADRYPKDLSGGMKQRVAIARTLINRPSIVLMDEPFGALDAQTRLLMQELLIRVWESHRLTVLFVTHDVDEAVFISDRVVVMTNRPGKIKEEVTVDLPRPRAFELQATPEFLALRSRVLASIREETLRSDLSISPGGGASR